MSRVEADHLAREAIVYVRQSTIDQVINNVESRRREYGLVERARQLGWANVSVIDATAGSARWCRSRRRSAARIFARRRRGRTNEHLDFAIRQYAE